MNNLNIGNEEKLILYCSIYGDIDLAESIQENVDMDKVSGKRFLDVLRGNAYQCHLDKINYGKISISHSTAY